MRVATIALGASLSDELGEDLVEGRLVLFEPGDPDRPAFGSPRRCAASGHRASETVAVSVARPGLADVLDPGHAGEQVRRRPPASV